jgi:hypothetical protein
MVFDKVIVYEFSDPQKYKFFETKKTQENKIRIEIFWKQVLGIWSGVTYSTLP